MRTKIVKQIFKKEILDILRDKKTIFMMVILPIILYPIMMIGMTQVMTMSMNSMHQKDINIGVSQNIDKELLKIINEDNKYKKDENIQAGTIKIIETKDYKIDLEEGNIDAYIQIEKDNNLKEFNIYIDSSKDSSNIARNEISAILDIYKDTLVKKSILDSGLNVNKTLQPISYETIDTAKSEAVAGKMLGQILPFVLIVGLLMGAMYPAIDVMAGEKERGTLETLFTLPISNLELVIGKYMAVSACAIASAILNVLSIMLTLGYLMVSQDLLNQMGAIDINLNELVLPMIITIICVCLFAMVVSAVSMCVCSLAKSFKDAQNYITPVSLFVMIPSYVSMIPNINLNYFTATIPVINISLLIKSVLTFNSDISLISLVLFSNLIFVILSVLLLSKMFNSEEILFGSSKSFYILEKRSNIKKGNMPSVADGVALYLISVLLLIYVGSIIQIKFGMGGISLTQIMFAGIALLFAYYIKANFKKTFSIKIPNIIQIIGGIILWFGTFIVVNIITQFLLYLFPQNMQVVEGLNEVLKIESSLVLNIIIIALFPAICEEILFRGFILSSFTQSKNKKSKLLGVIFSGILFGFMHIDFIRVIPTSILGIALGYSAYKTGSIFIPMIIHFINNALAVFALHFTPKEVATTEQTISFIDNIDILGISFIVGLCIVFLGHKILNIKAK